MGLPAAIDAFVELGPAPCKGRDQFWPTLYVWVKMTTIGCKLDNCWTTLRAHTGSSPFSHRQHHPLSSTKRGMLLYMIVCGLILLAFHLCKIPHPHSMLWNQS